MFLKPRSGAHGGMYIATQEGTYMSKKVGPRLRELAIAARGSPDAGSRNLAFAYFDMSVCGALNDAGMQ